MTVEWNNCFLCLNDLSNKNADRNILPNRISVLLGYLLDYENVANQLLLENIRTLLEIPDKPQICDLCQFQVERLNELNIQLEVIQLKLINLLKTVRRTIIACSKDGGDIRLELFEDWLKSKETVITTLENSEQERLSQQREYLKILYAFQNAVIDAGNRAVQVPRVFLDKFVPYKPQVYCSEHVELKSEENSFEIDTFFEEFHTFSPSPNQESYSQTVNDPVEDVKFKNPVVSKKRKYRKAPKEPVPRKLKKSSRTSSAVASLRISNASRTTKIKSEPSDDPGKPHKQVRLKILPSFAVKHDSQFRLKSQSKTLYNCESCIFATKHPFTFEHHLRSHDEEGQPYDLSLKCTQCDLTFSCKQYYELHMAGHSGQYVIRCDICLKMFDPSLIKSHMKTHLDKVFPCSYCSFCCSTRDRFLSHLKSHPKCPLECDICGEKFTSRNLLFTHYSQNHDAVRPKICGIKNCTKEFLDPVLLTRHRNMNHSKNPVPTCSVCKATFDTTTALKVHFRQHSGEKPFACEDCEERFSTKHILNRHLVSKHGAPKFKCEFCGKSYNDKASLRVHQASTHNTPGGHPCEICGQICGNKTLLRRHLLKHSDERNYVCEDCGLTFKYQHIWYRHTKTHGAEKKFKCEYCGKSFLFERYLKIHVLIHTGERPFVCEICGKDFNQQSAYCFHKRKVHSKAKEKGRIGKVEQLELDC